MQLFNARTQQIETTEDAVDANNEIVSTFADGGFLKFPAGLTKPDLDGLIVAQQVANEGQVVITPEMEAEAAKLRAASEALIEDETNVPIDAPS